MEIQYSHLKINHLNDMPSTKAAGGGIFSGVFNKDVKVPVKVRRTLSSVGTSSSINALERTPPESNPSTTTPSILSDCIDIDQNHRSLRAPYSDPITVILRQAEYPLFVVPKANLDDTKHAEPMFISVHPADPGNGRLVVDILRNGSRLRPELMSMFHSSLTRL